MHIEKHRLVGVRFEETNHLSGEMTPEYVVIHYTASQTASGAIATFKAPGVQASAHLVIDLDGSLIQMVPFNRVAWHAGKSQWAGRIGCNQFTIGIEVVNPGYLKSTGTGYIDCYGRPFKGEVLKARHRNSLFRSDYWAAYTPEQLQAVEEVCRCLFEAYPLRDVVGHEDVAPGRKCDPGPAFPMDLLRSRVTGRDDDGPPHFVTTTELNVRQGPGVQFPTVPNSPLAQGAEVMLVDTSERWWHVMTPDGTVEGWAHSAYLHPTERRPEHASAVTASELPPSWGPPRGPEAGESIYCTLDPRVDITHAVGVLPCPGNPPPPDGWKYWKGAVPPGGTRFAETLLFDPRTYPMGTFAQTRLGDLVVGARVEWHNYQGRTGKRGCFRGVNLMQAVV